jgi:hypothetical protein
MWSATFVTGLSRGRVALVLVMHHVVADGLGAPAVIGELVDDGSAPYTATAPTRFPRPAPSRRALVIDAWTTRLHAIREFPGRLPQLIPAVAELSTVQRFRALIYQHAAADRDRAVAEAMSGLAPSTAVRVGQTRSRRRQGVGPGQLSLADA